MFSPALFVFFAPYENWFRNLLPLWTCKPSSKMFSPVLFVASAHMKMGSRLVACLDVQAIRQNIFTGGVG